MEDEGIFILHNVPNSKMFDVHCTQLLGIM
jgi:hypothetical protein